MAYINGNEIIFPGNFGFIPRKGVDYWTDEDKMEILNEVIAALGGSPVFGVVDASGNITLSGLAAGTYTLRYENEDGTKTDIGSLVVGSEDPDTPVTPSYTNLFNPDTATLNARYSVSSGTMSSSGTGMVLTDFIPVTIVAGETKILRIRGATFTGNNSATFYFKNTSTMNPPTNKVTCGMGISTHNGWGNVYTDDNGDAYIKLGYLNSTQNNASTEAFDSVMTQTTYIRLQIYISSASISKSDIENIIITIDEPITD